MQDDKYIYPFLAGGLVAVDWDSDWDSDEVLVKAEPTDRVQGVFSGNHPRFSTNEK